MFCLFSLLAGLLSRFSIVADVIVLLVLAIEGVVETECCHINKALLFERFIFFVHLPGSPSLHDAEELELVVCCLDKLFNHTISNLLFDGTYTLSLINDLHSPASLLSNIVLVAILFRQIVDLLQDQVIELHEFHSWEWFYIDHGESCGELQRSSVMHILLVVENTVPDRHGRLLISLFLAHWSGIRDVWVLEVGAEAANSSWQH